MGTVYHDSYCPSISSKVLELDRIACNRLSPLPKSGNCTPHITSLPPPSVALHGFNMSAVSCIAIRTTMHWW
jgi:hypothetical protein